MGSAPAGRGSARRNGVGRCWSTTIIAALMLVPVAGAPGAQRAESGVRDWSCLAVSAAVGSAFRSISTPACTPETVTSKWPQPERRIKSAAPLVAPGVPTGLAAVVSGQTVALSWAMPAGGDPPASYIVQAGSASGLSDLANFSTGSTLTSLTVINVPPALYFVRVLATNASGTSGPSNEIVVAVGGACATAPGSPSGLTGTVTGTTVALAWQPPAGGCPATSYIVEAGTGPGVTNLASVPTGTSATTFTAANVAFGVYFVRVRAVNGAGVSAPSNEVAITVGCAPPAAAGTLAARVSGTIVELDWIAAPGTLSGYVVLVGSAPGLANLGTIPTGNTATRFTAGGVPAGVYYVRVAATNACSNGPASNEVVVNVGSGRGTAGLGTVFRITPAGTFSVLHVFDDGLEPQLPVTQASDGSLYGGTQGSAIGQPPGALFRIAANGAYTRVVTFPVPLSPSAPLIQASDGNIYGGTDSGGDFQHGSIFRVTATGVVTTAYSFAGGSDGAVPRGLLQTADGSFYVITASGGQFLGGSVVRFGADGSATTLHAFVSSSEGFSPSPIVQGIDGNLYGTMQSGGANSCGTAFRVTPAGGFAILHVFTCGIADGSGPNTALVVGRDGNFYGTTAGFAPAQTRGAVFRMTPNGDVTVLHTFAGAPLDGEAPKGLVLGSDGNFYGTTFFGGLFGEGTVFRMTPAGSITILHSFSGGDDDGNRPFVPLIQASDGNFYGTTTRR